MKINQVKCKLFELKAVNNKTVIVLKELENNACHQIIVDESIPRIKQRFKEQYAGDERDGIFLSRGMIDINISTKGDVWDINQEDFNYYTFEKSDVLKFCK